MAILRRFAASARPQAFGLQRRNAHIGVLKEPGAERRVTMSPEV